MISWSCAERGEHPEVEEYIQRHPQHAGVIQNLFASLQFIRLSNTDAAKLALTTTAEIQSEGQLGDFRIVREIGRGGMGVVYEAVQISLGRRVALKVLPFAAALDAKHLQRFKNEAQAAAGLQHSNIVPVYHVGCDRGVHYYAMQHIDGQTLAEVIDDSQTHLAPIKKATAPESADDDKQLKEPGKEGRSAGGKSTIVAWTTERSAHPSTFFRSIARLGIQGAEVAEYADQLGIVHRDIKPANILIDGRGTLWITDFGLAQVQTNDRLTMTGDVVGTLRYMSPEQALAHRGCVDHRTDIYSWGVTLYELITLRPAFGAVKRHELLRQIEFEEPLFLRQLNRAVPAELETIVRKAMEKDPLDRYASAQDLADDLRRFLEEKPIRAKHPTVMQRMTKWCARTSPS